MGELAVGVDVVVEHEPLVGELDSAPLPLGPPPLAELFAVVSLPVSREGAAKGVDDRVLEVGVEELHLGAVAEVV
eukprot:6203933-Pleurochrysis_carterae.AAC.2